MAPCSMFLLVHPWDSGLTDGKDVLAKNPAMHGAILVPIILGSNKTMVSVATGQNDYYPLYLPIGNIHNNTHHAHRNSLVLIAFLTIPKSTLLLIVAFVILTWSSTIIADHENEDTAKFHKFRCQLFHTTLAHILSSLWHGMSKPKVQWCPDGHFRHAAYALAAYIADYPEQVLLSCLIQGWCPL